MANKAVVGLAALGVTAYTVSEGYADWRARQEERNRNQEAQDRAEENARRLAEAHMKQGGYSLNGLKNEIQAQTMFMRQVWASAVVVAYPQQVYL